MVTYTMYIRDHIPLSSSQNGKVAEQIRRHVSFSIIFLIENRPVY
jgi:hypothetical protein